MGSILNEAARAAICRRIAGVTSGSKPRWGRFDVRAMLAHLRVSALMAIGEHSVACKSPRVLRVFPLKHLSLAFSDGFKPLLNGNGFAFAGDAATYAIGQHLLVMALWGLFGAVIAFAFFRWERQRGGSRR